ncbi:MAG: 50S ribosomal protein L24 [Saprospiraceae bacterium]|nr:50S ribosomal protein L24 [Saprospiraceae bacterium]
MSVKRFAPKLHIKKGDKVKVIAGSDRGSVGEVKMVFPSENKAIVDGLNMKTKHIKPVNDNPGGINQIEAPIHLSNLMLVDPKSGQPTRTGRKDVDGKSKRFSKKSGEIIK